MAAGAHFGCPKFTLDLISGHFRSIRNFIFIGNFLTKWLPSAILDVRNSLSIEFLATLDQYGILFYFEFFHKMAAGGNFGCSKITFDWISGHFRSIGHFGCLKFTFDSNSGHFRSIQNFIVWPFCMSQNHFRLLLWPFLIDRPYWMSEIHFRWHFWPFQVHTDIYYYYYFFTKWPPAAISMGRQCQLSNSSEIFG